MILIYAKALTSDLVLKLKKKVIFINKINLSQAGQ